MAIGAVFIGYKINNNLFPTITQVFLIVVLLEIPFSLKGYKLDPEATILERMIVAGVFGSFSYALSEAFLKNVPLITF